MHIHTNGEKSLTGQEEIHVLVSSQVDGAQREDVVAQTADEPDGPHRARTASHPPGAEEIQNGELLFGLRRPLLRLAQQSSAVLPFLRLQELLHRQRALQAVEAGYRVQQGLSVFVAALGHQVKRRLWELPAEEQEGRRARGEDELVDPPNPHQVTGESHHHDADGKGRMHVHGGPRAYFDASELGHVDKHHHQVAA